MPKGAKVIAYLRIENSKTIPYLAVHIYIGTIWEYTPPPSDRSTAKIHLLGRGESACNKAMKSGKGDGADRDTAKMLKAEVKKAPHFLADIFKDEREQIPEVWKAELFVKLFTSDLGEWTNWRGITLLRIISKVFHTIHKTGGCTRLLHHDGAG